VEQLRRTGGWVAAVGGVGEAQDKQPGERERNGQQQPGPQPRG
jgi:hypothetical protein